MIPRLRVSLPRFSLPRQTKTAVKWGFLTALDENRDEPRFIKRHRGVLQVNRGFTKKIFPWVEYIFDRTSINADQVDI
jgi:hypothetical protein